MTLRKTYPARMAGAAHRIIAGSFIPNGSSTISTKYGYGFSVAYTATGTYTVTLDAPFSNYVSIVVTGQFATSEADSHQFLVGTCSVTNKTFVIKHVTSTDVSTTDLAAADISTSGTANKINFICIVAQSDIPGAGV